MENQSTNEHRNNAGEQKLLEMQLDALNEIWTQDEVEVEA